MNELKTLDWGIFDIQDVRQDLPDHQALIVLDYIKANYDYKNGMTDAAIRTAANELYPESKL
jgi:hypothetical protein